jgi:hypothetical protein
MSTVGAWLDDIELDWSAPAAAPAVRARRRPTTTRGAWPKRILWALATLIAASVAAGVAVAGRDATDPLPPAPPLQVPDAAEPAAAPATTLDAIAHCESRGDPAAVSPDGRYRGKYQFDLATWQSVGGAGDPALASEAEQDRRAQSLAAQRGTAPWPICGAATAGG